MSTPTRTHAQKRQFVIDNPFGTTRSRTIKRNRADYTKRISIPGGGNSTLTFVLSGQLLEIIQPALDAIVNEQKDDTRINQETANGTMTFARRTCGFGHYQNAEAVARRLFALRDGRERTTDVAIADAMCLAANNPFGIQLIHVFPRHWRGAIEVAAAWAFARDLDPAPWELDDIAAETLEAARALWHRPERQVTVTVEAFQAIGGEPSRWLTTGR